MSNHHPSTTLTEPKAAPPSFLDALEALAELKVISERVLFAASIANDRLYGAEPVPVQTNETGDPMGLLHSLITKISRIRNDALSTEEKLQKILVALGERDLRL